MRTLALFPPVLAINPSRIRIWRVTKLFQPSLATKNLRSISSGIELFRFSSDVELEHRILKCLPPGGLVSVAWARRALGFCVDCYVVVVAAACKKLLRQRILAVQPSSCRRTSNSSLAARRVVQAPTSRTPALQSRLR